MKDMEARGYICSSRVDGMEEIQVRSWDAAVTGLSRIFKLCTSVDGLAIIS